MRWRDFIQTRRVRQLWYLPVLAIAMALMMFRVLLMARLLNVDGFAQFSIGLLLSTTFCMLGCLGLQSMLQRDMPIMFVRHRSRAAMVLLAQSMLIACACAMAAGVLCGLGLTVGISSPGVTALGIVHGLSQQAFLLTTVESRSRGEPLHYARQNLVRALALVIAGSVAGELSHSAPLVLAVETAISLLCACDIARRSCRRSGYSVRGLVKIAYRRLPSIRWKTASVFFLVSMIGFILLNTDRWIAVHFLSERSFALYAFAAIVLTVAQSSQSMVNASVYPMLSRQFARHGLEATYKICKRLSSWMVVLSVLLAVPLFFVFSLVIRHWFVEYESVIVVLPIFMITAVFRISDFWSSFMMLCGFERQLLKLNTGVFVISLATWAMVVYLAESTVAPIELCAMLSALLSVGIYLGAFASCRLTFEAKQRPSS